MSRLDRTKGRYGIWNIGLVHEPISSFLKSGGRHDVRWFPRQKDGWVADPFFLKIDGNLCVLCEQLVASKRMGRIAYFELRDGDQLSEARPAFEPPHHVSYPYTFEGDGEVYCVPEATRAGEIALYKISGSPNEWRRIGVITSFVGSDPTIIRYDGSWWLFASAGGEDLSKDLYLWYASSLSGPWIPHAANPVKSDASSSRPGGTPFMHNNCLYRPAQDCSKTYGGRIVLSRILRLTTTEFEEELVSFVEPDPEGPYPDGLHTISGCGELTLIDGKRFGYTRIGLIKNKIFEIPAISRLLAGQ
ncbi:MAG: hypothetical protein ACLPY5_10160 [Candidatus Bathyarchaeia archaeon]